MPIISENHLCNTSLPIDGALCETVICHFDSVQMEGEKGVFDVDKVNNISDRKSTIRVLSDGKRVDLMIERLGLIVINEEGHEVKLSDFKEEDIGNSSVIENRNNKGWREIQNLKWDMKDKENSGHIKRAKRTKKGKKIVHP